MKAFGLGLALVSLGFAMGACDSDVDTQDGGGGAGAGMTGGAGEGGTGAAGGGSARALGLNDVTMLVPIPSTASTVLLRAADAGDDGSELVPRELFDRLNDRQLTGEPIPGPIFFDVYEDLQALAIRFDLCDRVVPGECPEGEDGRLRIVFQAVADGDPPGAADVAFHAFYIVPKAELPSVVAELRALAELQDVDAGEMLQVNPALSASTDGEYATRLTALVTKYAGSQTLTRLTFFAQPQQFAQVRWVFRGLERTGDGFEDIIIPSIDVDDQQVITEGMTGFELRPGADSPVGLELVVDDAAFAAASADEQTTALEALVASDNPLTHTPDTVQCAACHVSTLLLGTRAGLAGIDPLEVEGRFEAAGFDLTPTVADGRTLRALGWIGTEPRIAQRTVNESAQAALEMNQRF